MPMMSSESGWAFPQNANKAHYFSRGDRSLCGRWLFAGELEPETTPSVDDCLTCRTKLEGAR